VDCSCRAAGRSGRRLLDRGKADTVTCRQGKTAPIYKPRPARQSDTRIARSAGSTNVNDAEIEIAVPIWPWAR
jgi:hypothetical protein